MEENKKIKQLLHELNRIEEEKGYLVPADVVQEAKDPNSPLHDSFEWDDSLAAQQHRLWQARKLITRVKVEFMGEERQAYYNASVEVRSVPVRGYFSLDKVLNDEEIQEQVLIQAVKDLAYAYRKYESLKEIRDIFNKDKLVDLEKKLGVSA